MDFKKIFKDRKNTLSTKKVKLVESKLELTQEEIDCILEDIKSYFLDFRNILLDGEVDFTRLREADLAILRACRINLGLTLPSGYTCNIERLNSTHAFFRLIKLDFSDTTISYEPGKIISKKWSEFESITVKDYDIDINKAIHNLASESELYLSCSDYQFSNEVAKLTNLVIDEIASEQYVDFNSINYNDENSTSTIISA